MAMFLQDFQVVDRPFSEVEERLGGGIQALLTGGLEDARVAGEHLLVKVAPKACPPLLGKTVEIHTAAPRRHDDSVLLPFRWGATGTACLFPALEGNLEAAPLGSGQTQLVLRASYSPPGGRVGQGLDWMLLHRIAESTVRAFLHHVCAGLDQGHSSRSAEGTRRTGLFHEGLTTRPG